MPTNVDVNMKSAKPHNPAASGSPTNNKKRKRGHDPLGHSNREVSEKVSEKNSGLKERAKSLWPARKTLPVWSHVSEIRQGLREKDVMLLVGETGSGKSTQVPQILASEPWCRPQEKQRTKIGGCIAITEPRRVAAITLARRVAEEMGTPLGSSSPASRVGYSVRFDNSTSPCTQIKFLTEGMLLQEMLRDPWLKSYSAVIVDEVHERGVNVDLVLGFLRKMREGALEGRGGVRLKVVVMSATTEMERLGAFFEAGYQDPMGNETRRTHTGEDIVTNGDKHASEEESEWSGIHSDEDEANGPVRRQETIGKPASKAKTHTIANGVLTNGHPLTEKNGRYPKQRVHEEARIPRTQLQPGSTSQIQPTDRSDSPLRQQLPHVAICHIEGRQFPVTIKYTPEPVQDFVDASLRTIFQINYKEPMPGDILVFLTGQETIESLDSLIKQYALGLGPDVPKLLVLPLFAALPQAAQQQVFQPAPPKTRKVIISTNIAETSVTVPGVRFVIDCGKAKIKQFRTTIGLDSLLVKPISKSAAIQRKGRAGREAEGQCYRLYTEKSYLGLQQSNTPELLRCDLSHSVLTMKARGVVDLINYPFLDRPPREALEKALLKLFQSGALTTTGEISKIGLGMAKLPLAVSLGRALLAAAESEPGCVSEAIDIISCLSVENIFLNLTSEEKKEQAENARRELYRREGDHLTLLATIQGYAAERTDRKAWADRHFVSHRAIRSAMDVRKQLRTQCQLMGMLKERHDDVVEVAPTTSELAVSILKSFLKGFASNTARITLDGSYKTFVGNQSVAIHPSSGLFGKKVEAIMYNEFVYTNRSYARGVSAVQMDWVGEVFDSWISQLP